MKSSYLHSIATALLIAVLLAAPLPTTPAFAAAFAGRFPTIGTDVDTIGTVIWSDPGNIGANDGIAATALLTPGTTSHYMRGTGYDFSSIQSYHTIVGIRVDIKRKASNSSALVDNVVQLVKGGSPVGDNRADTSTTYGSVYGVATYGGPEDLWGTTWAPAEVNSPDFGAALAVSNTQGIADETASVDYIRITVYYGVETTTAVDCSPSSVTYGGTTMCTASVTRSGGTRTPSGTVNWSTDGSGTFSEGGACTLAGDYGTTTCSVTYTPSDVGTGTHIITADYLGDIAFLASGGEQSITVNKMDLTVSATGVDKIYDGTTAATVVLSSNKLDGDVIDLDYTSAAFADKSAGTEAVNVSGISITGGADAANYNLQNTTASTTANIAPAPLEVTANNARKMAGTTDPAFTYSITGGSLFGTDALTGELAREPGETVGTYAILQGTLAAPADYNLAFIPGVFTIDSGFTATFTSIATQDGRILESSETSGAGAVKSNLGGLIVGDDPMNRQWRSILSFDTSSLPDDAVITSVTLKVKRQKIVGTNPFRTHGALLVDIRQGSFRTSKLELADFRAAPSLAAAGKLGKTLLTGGWYEGHLTSNALLFVNKTGLTQFRLRFRLDDNNDWSSDYLVLYSGNALVVRQPILIITYDLP